MANVKVSKAIRVGAAGEQPVTARTTLTGRIKFQGDGAAMLANAANTSIMWLGDSLTQGAANDYPLGDRHARRWRNSPSLTNINANGGCVRYLNADESCPPGAGTLRFYAADKSFSWQANGQSEGPRTPAPVGGFVTVESGSSGAAVHLALIARNYPTADAADAVTIAAGGRARANLNGFVGMASAMIGCQFDPEYNFGISGQRATDCLLHAAQWENVFADITHIALGTNDCSDQAGAEAGFDAVKQIIQKRLAIGSRVIVAGLLPYSGATAAQTGVRQWFDTTLREYCRAIGVDYWSAYRYVCAQDGTDSWRSGLSGDGLHPVMSGSYVIAKTATVPALNKLVRKTDDFAFSGKLYDPVSAPYGSLTPNPYLSGTTGTKGSTGTITGDVPTGFTVTGANANVSVACKTQSSASPVVRTDGVPGNWMQMLITSSGVSSVYMYPSSFPDWTRVSVGDYIVLEGEFYISGTGAKLISGSIGNYALAFEGNAVGALDGGVLQFKFRSRPVRITGSMATNTNLNITIGVESGANLDVRIGSPLSIHKVPAPVF